MTNRPVNFNDPTGHAGCDGDYQGSCADWAKSLENQEQGGDGPDPDDELNGGEPDNNGCVDTNGNGYIDIPCQTHPLVWMGRSSLCPKEFTLVECYYAGGLLDMSGGDITIDPSQFGDMAIAIHYDINNRPDWSLSILKASMDTPFWNYYGKYSGSGCLNSVCGSRSEINYFEQGMISARLDQSIEEGLGTVNTWKKYVHRLPEAIKTGDFTTFNNGPYASNNTYTWFKLGYYTEIILSATK